MTQASAKQAADFTIPCSPGLHTQGFSEWQKHVVSNRKGNAASHSAFDQHCTCQPACYNSKPMDAGIADCPGFLQPLIVMSGCLTACFTFFMLKVFVHPQTIDIRLLGAQSSMQEASADKTNTRKLLHLLDHLAHTHMPQKLLKTLMYCLPCLADNASLILRLPQDPMRVF